MKVTIIKAASDHLIYFVKSCDEFSRPHKIVFYGMSFCRTSLTLTVQKQIFYQEPTEFTALYLFYFEKWDFIANISEFMDLTYKL